MAVLIKRPFVLALLGTSLTNGRLAAPPNGWDLELKRHMMSSPECKGEVQIINLGKGSQTSDWGVLQAPLIRDLRPTHLLMEDFAINGPEAPRASKLIMYFVPVVPPILCVLIWNAPRV